MGVARTFSGFTANFRNIKGRSKTDRQMGNEKANIFIHNDDDQENSFIIEKTGNWEKKSVPEIRWKINQSLNFAAFVAEPFFLPEKKQYQKKLAIQPPKIPQEQCSFGI